MYSFGNVSPTLYIYIVLLRSSSVFEYLHTSMPSTGATFVSFRLRCGDYFEMLLYF